MELLERIKKQLSEHKIKLLCQIHISDFEYNKLLDQTRGKILNLHCQMNPNPDIMLAVSLVQIAIREYNDGNYWDYFLDVLGIDVSTAKRNYLGKVFISTLRYYGLFEIYREEKSRYAYVENIKAHAFVPNNYLSGYFDFLFSFYDRNLFRQITDDLDENIYEMIDFMVDSLSSNSDDVKIENFGSRPAKTYRLLKATKNAIAHCSPAIICNLISEHLLMIDNYYYDGKVPKNKDRFSLGFIAWSESKESEINCEPFQKKTRKVAGIFYRNPYFEIDRSKNQGYIVIPSQKIRESEFNGRAYVLIKNDSENIERELVLYRAYGVIVSEQLKVPIENIFSSYNIEIVSGTNRYFNKPEKEYLLLDEDFKEIQKLNKGHCYILVKKGISIESNLTPVYVNKNHFLWDEYSFGNITDDSVIYINKKPISLAGEYSDKPLFEFVSKEYILFFEEKQIQTAYRHPIISFKVARNALAGTFIWCNNTRFRAKIKNISSTYEFENDIENLGVTIALSNILSNVDGLYNIWLDEPGKPRKLICKYVLISALRCRWEKPRFIFCDRAIISILGGYNIEPINCKRINEHEYCLNLTNGLEEAKFNLFLGGLNYLLVVPIRAFKYGFSRQWNYIRKKYVWHSDLKNDLYIYMPGATQAFVYLNKNDEDKIEGEKQGDGEFRFDILNFVKKIRASTRAFSYINLKYYDNKWRNLSLLRILRRIWIDKLYMEQSKNSIRIISEYEGNAKLKVKIIDYITEKVISEKVLKNGNTNFPELKTESLYRLQKFEVASDPFGLSKNITFLGEIYKIGAINFSNLSNCKIMIKDIICNNYLLNLNYRYTVHNLIKENDFTYIGKLTSRPKITSPKNRKEQVFFEKVRIELLLEDKEIHILSIHAFENNDWVKIWYDSLFRKLISSTDQILDSSNDYKRFTQLYEDNTEYKVEVWRVK